MYYKLIDGQNIVGVASLDNFRKYQPKHGQIMYSTIEQAQYVEYKDSLYRDAWLRPTVTDNVEFRTVSVIRIDESEYDALKEAFETKDEIAVEVQ